MSAKKQQKWYAVRNGKNGPAIYKTWDQCYANVSGFPSAKFKSFLHLKDAELYLSGIDTLPQPPSEIIKHNILQVYTDGSCANPGTLQAKAGAGVYIPAYNIRVSYSVPGKQTNNRGELWAVIQAIRYIINLKEFIDQTIEVHLDSAYVMGNLKSHNKLNLDLWSELQNLVNNYKITWVKEKAHSGLYGNELADLLAKKIAFSNYPEHI